MLSPNQINSHHAPLAARDENYRASWWKVSHLKGYSTLTRGYSWRELSSLDRSVEASQRCAVLGTAPASALRDKVPRTSDVWVERRFAAANSRYCPGWLCRRRSFIIRTLESPALSPGSCAGRPCCARINRRLASLKSTLAAAGEFMGELVAKAIVRAESGAERGEGVESGRSVNVMFPSISTSLCTDWADAASETQRIAATQRRQATFGRE